MVATSTSSRTQAERSADTTRRLLDATLDTLAEHGYQGTTTTEVARRAGVSRGAMLHHFPHRNALLAAAAERMIDTRIAEFRDAMARIPASADRVRAAIDLLWEICSSTIHVAWTELALAARNDPELAPVVAELERTVQIRVRETWAETFPELQSRDHATVAPDFALSLLEGLAFRQLVTADRDRSTAVVDALKHVATLILSDPPPSESPT